MAVAAFPLQLAWTILPGGAALSLACATAGGIYVLVAIMRRVDRAIAVCVAVAPLVLTVLFVAAEVSIGHD